MDAKANAGEGYKHKDLKGNTLLPGLIDAHAHFASFSAQAIGARYYHLQMQEQKIFLHS